MTTPNPTLWDAARTAGGPAATSRAAAAAVRDSAATLRQRVLDYLRSRGRQGATDEEIQLALGMPGNTQRPRRQELERAGLVLPLRSPGNAPGSAPGDAYVTRATRSGRQAQVWVAALAKDSEP